MAKGLLHIRAHKNVQSIKAMMKKHGKRCVLCGISGLPMMMRKIDSVWLCKGCYDEIFEKEKDRLVLNALKKRGVFNPSRR